LHSFSFNFVYTNQPADLTYRSDIMQYRSTQLEKLALNYYADQILDELKRNGPTQFLILDQTLILHTRSL